MRHLSTAIAATTSHLVRHANLLSRALLSPHSHSIVFWYRNPLIGVCPLNVSAVYCVSSRSASSAVRPFPRPTIRRRGGSTDVAPRDKTDDPAIRVKSNLEPPTQEVLAGLVERVTFHNEENGFCVLRTKARGQRDLVTVIGQAATISAGEWITASGEWVNDRTHGLQFRARFLKASPPTSIDGIEKYLGSGMVPGIGPVYAKKLVQAFGDQVFDTIEAAPERLREVTGIGPVRAKRITDAWAEQKVVREIMTFLHRQRRRDGARGADLQDLRRGRRSGDEREPVPAGPRGARHRLQDRGRHCDGASGVEKTAMIRLRAGVSFALAEAMDDGALRTADRGADFRLPKASSKRLRT